MLYYFWITVFLKGFCLFFFLHQWVPEITHHCPKTPFLLVGTQIDLRDDPSTVEKLAKNKQKPITPETAEKLARDLKAVKYVECSALTQVRARITQYTNSCSNKHAFKVMVSQRGWKCFAFVTLTAPSPSNTVSCACLCPFFSSFCSGDWRTYLMRLS